jgi:multimeric flavodoxin WrbA
MNVLIVLGSPRKNGNSETVAQTITETLSQKLPVDIEYLRLTKYDIAPCIGCGGCEKTGICVVKDDMIDLYRRTDEADIILLASPIYFYGPSAQIKAYIDRFQARWSRKYLLKERVRQNEKRGGYLISTGATSGKKLFDASILIAKSFFDAIDVPYCDSFVVRGVDEKGAIKNKVEELKAAQHFAQEIRTGMTSD